MPTLNWLTRDDDVRAAHRTPYRLLEEVRDHSVGNVDSENMLIRGDNLEALKALQPFCSGRVKCIYIDPPYNTRAAFEHYDDNLEHTRWLAMMWPRLELLRDLLAEDGSIWVSIDNAEGAYLKVLLDEVFGRSNFVTTCVWQQRTTRENRKVFSEDHEYLHVYASEYPNFRRSRNPLELSDAVKARYRNPDNDPRGPWQWNGTGGSKESPLLGLHDGRAYALLYNGILGDRRPAGGNVLTRATLAGIRSEVTQTYPKLVGEHPAYPLTIYGEQSRLTLATLARERIDFKQTPYDVRARA